MSIDNYIDGQDPARQEILWKIHGLVIKTNPKVEFSIEPLMGKDAITYKLEGFFIYGLSSLKNQLSLHLMPIYFATDLNAKYSKLLMKAKVQKGCINFKSFDEFPADIIENLLSDCAKFDLITVMKKHKKV